MSKNRRPKGGFFDSHCGLRVHEWHVCRQFFTDVSRYNFTMSFDVPSLVDNRIKSNQLKLDIFESLYKWFVSFLSLYSRRLNYFKPFLHSSWMGKSCNRGSNIWDTYFCTIWLIMLTSKEKLKTHYPASVVIELNLVHERIVVVFIHCLKFHQIIHDATASTHHQVIAKQDIMCSWCIACCELTPTLARRMWRHNCVIGRNEYLISTLLESSVS